MTYLKEIDEIIKRQVDLKVRDTLEKFIPVICRRYPESFIQTQLWTDLKEIDELFKTLPNNKKNTPICKGVTKGGTPCRTPVKSGGYCCNHQSQKPTTCIISTPKEESKIPVHNHNVFKIKYSEDCPACKAKKSN